MDPCHGFNHMSTTEAISIKKEAVDGWRSDEMLT